MGCSSFCNRGITVKSTLYGSGFLSPPSPSTSSVFTKNSVPYSSFSSQAKCCHNSRNSNEGPLSSSLSYHDILGVSSNCTASELKAAFRAKVKQFHPDVNREGESSDEMIRRVIEAYEMLSNYSRSEIIEGECLDPFDKPESEAFDLFVNEARCIGVGCPCSCVKRAPQAFAFSSSTRTARAITQGHYGDDQVQLVVGQCPRSCIHYVTPLQRIILEELLDSIIDKPYDTSAEAELLYSLITKAKYENNRFQKPKKKPKVSTKEVDWY